MLVQNGLNDGLFGHRFPLLRFVRALRLVIVDVKAQDIFIINGMGDGIGVQPPLKEVNSRSVGCFLPLDLTIDRVVFKDRCAGEAK